MTTQYTSHNM